MKRVGVRLVIPVTDEADSIARAIIRHRSIHRPRILHESVAGNQLTGALMRDHIHIQFIGIDEGSINCHDGINRFGSLVGLACDSEDTFILEDTCVLPHCDGFQPLLTATVTQIFQMDDNRAKIRKFSIRRDRYTVGKSRRQQRIFIDVVESERAANIILEGRIPQIDSPRQSVMQIDAHDGS